MLSWVASYSVAVIVMVFIADVVVVPPPLEIVTVNVKLPFVPAGVVAVPAIA